MLKLAGCLVFLVSLKFLLKVSSQLGPDLHVFGGTGVQGCIVVMGYVTESTCQPFSTFGVVLLKQIILRADNYSL